MNPRQSACHFFEEEQEGAIANQFTSVDTVRTLRLEGECRLVYFTHIELEEMLLSAGSPTETTSPAEVPKTTRRHNALLAGLAGLLAGGLLAGAVLFLIYGREAVPSPVRLSITQRTVQRR